MLNNGHLNLRLNRLQPGESWNSQSEGMVFLFPRDGEGRFPCGPNVLPLVAGDVGVIDAGVAPRLSATGKRELVFWSVSLCVEHLFPLFGSEELALLHNVCESLRGGRRYPAASELAGECHRILMATPPQSNLDHRCQLLRVAAAVLTEEFTKVTSQRAGFQRMEDHILQVFEKLSATEIVELSVGELADKFNCSRRHLNRLFHQYFGFSVAALRMEMRLLKAVSLLRDREAKIINVAEQCGFNHLGLFNSCFKRRFGTSPGEWRKSLLLSPEKRKPAEPTQPGAAPACQLRANGLCPWADSVSGYKTGLVSPFQTKGEK